MMRWRVEEPLLQPSGKEGPRDLKADLEETLEIKSHFQLHWDPRHQASKLKPLAYLEKRRPQATPS